MSNVELIDNLNITIINCLLLTLSIYTNWKMSIEMLLIVLFIYSIMYFEMF